MSDSPAAPTPYEVLGVDPGASDAELKRAYRRLLRKTHPDTGGDPARFHSVQQAWERIGDKVARARWDAGNVVPDRTSPPRTAGSASSTSRTTGSSVRARAYGHPGGFARERFLVLMREWAGRGNEPDDPYDPALVRTAPRSLRHLLAKALAEEATARAVSSLGIGYTIWSGVATSHGSLDHAVLGPAGLFTVMSEDWGSRVRLVRGDLVGDGIPAGETPVRTLTRRARAFGRSSRVRSTGSIVVVPDADLDEPIVRIGRKNDAAVVRLSTLPMVLRDGLGGGQRLSIEDVFDVRTRIQQSVNFV